MGDKMNEYADVCAERDALKAELEQSNIAGFTAEGVMQEYKQDRDHWRTLAEKAREAINKIGYAQGDGHPLALMKVAREALALLDSAKGDAKP
jgi:hypothetical protein